MHRGEGDSSIDLHRSLVEECIARLQRLQPSAVAVQGTHILSVLLTEAKQAPRPTSSSRKRGPPLDPESTDQQRRLKIRKLVGKPIGERNASTIKHMTAQAPNTDPATESADGREQELEGIDSRVPQMLPPQAGFSNEFLFNELLDLWV
jgi:hypothetical protein